MNVIFVSFLLLTIFLGAVGSFAQVRGQSSGFVQYSVALGSKENPTLQVSGLVNESVQPAGQAGFIDLTLGVAFNSSSFVFSRDVNSSSLPEFFPYLPTITNQSLSYAFHGYSATVGLVNEGQVQVQFNGTVYSGTKYSVSFSLSNSSNESPITGVGDVVCLPSGLIDTVQLSFNQTGTISATLVSTDLPLNSASTDVNPVGISIFGVLVIIVVAIAVLAIYSRARKNKSMNQADERETDQGDSAEGESGEKQEEKPSYWVD